MSSFNHFEKRLAQLLKKFPLVKKVLKRGYQYLNYFLFKNKRKEFFYNSLRKFSFQDSETFFGYYDKSPINIGNNIVLWHSVNQDKRNKHPNNSFIEVVVYDLVKESVINTYQTTTWNWQQGARLQWLTSDKYAFNDFDENLNKFITRVYSIQEDYELKRFEFPIQDAFKNQYFLSLNYTRLNTLRPDYGYRNLPNLSETELNTLNNDGIWYVDYKTGEGKLLISLETIVNFKYKDSFNAGKHYVNHIMISPNGDKFIFLHRYFLNGVRNDRLIQSDLQGNMRLLSEHNMISHYYWFGNSKVFGYMRGEDGTDGYYTINCEESSMILYDDEELQKYGDGHPNICGKKFVTDIYPDKSRTQTLIYGDLKRKEHIVLAHLHNNLKYDGEYRCDLHPRFSHDGTKVFFDTVHYGKRELCMMDLKDISI